MTVLIPLVFLAVFGLFNLFGINPGFFYNQLVFVLAAFFVYFILKSLGYRFFHLNSKVFYWLLILIIVLTFIFGGEIKGSKRWLNLYFFNLQGSEFLKTFFVLYLSEMLTVKATLTNSFRRFMESLLYFAIPFILIFKQPDLGNALIYLFIYIVMLFFSGIPKRFIWFLFGFSMFLFPASWFFLKEYQKSRIMSFFNPHLDTQGTAYNMIQSVITIGSGTFFGRGLGLGTQSRLSFLPESSTDFAYASLVEQFGFFGGFMVIIFFGMLVYLLVKRTLHFYFQRNIESKKNFLFCIGFVSYLVFQVGVNIGMNMGIMPVAGVALPFISYGGSSILALLIGFALLP